MERSKSNNTNNNEENPKIICKNTNGKMSNGSEHIIMH